MHGDDSNVDLSIRLVPVEAVTRKRQAVGRVIAYLLVASAVCVSLAVIWLFVARLRSRLGSPSVSSTVTRQRDAAADRAEAVRVYGRFDAIDERTRQRSPAERAERAAIDALVDQLESCAASDDDARFRELVDFDRLVKRIESTGWIVGWSGLQRKVLLSELGQWATVEPHWHQIVVAGVITPPDDRDSRILYTFTQNETGDPAEFRFWIGRAGAGWKLYDWERLDLGLSASEEWGFYCGYRGAPQLDGFVRWSELVVAADALTAAGEYDAAEEKLRLAESQLVPPELNDYHWLLTGHRWRALGKADDMERCYAAVRRPNDAPGVYYSRMAAQRWSDPAEALKWAERYQRAVGPTPDLLEVKAQLLTALNRREEAASEWGRLVRIQPDHAAALTELYLALPARGKRAFETQLAQLEDPVAAAVQIAPSVGYRDYHGLAFLIDYLQRNAPDAAGTWYVNGLACQLDGRYDEAAGAYRHAFEQETDDPTRTTYVNAYVAAMIADGRVLEAIRRVPDWKPVFQWLSYDYDDGESTLTDEEYRQLVALYTAQFPDDLTGLYRQASLAMDQERYGEAEQAARRVLAQTSMAGRGDGDGAETGSDDPETYREFASVILANALWKQGRREAALAVGDDRDERLGQLARAAVAELRWDDARRLLEMSRPDDAAGEAWREYVAGSLAAHERRWDDAVAHLQRAADAAAESDRWLFDRRFLEACIRSGRWQAYYEDHANRNEAFAALANQCVVDAEWDVLRALIAAHERRFPHDPQSTKHQAELAWADEQYGAYDRLASQLLHGANQDATSGYQRDYIEQRQLKALLRSGDFNQAMELARMKQRRDNDVAMLAIVQAAVGNLADAQRWARQAAAADKDAAEFYTDDVVGTVFLDDRFAALHDEFPVGLSASPSTVAVFVLDAPRPLAADDVAAALTRLGAGATTDVVPLPHADKNVTSAWAVRRGKASVWLATGDGKFDPWEAADKSAPLAAPVEHGRAWLAVGTAAWTEPDGEQAEALARRLGVALAAGHLTALRTREPAGWQRPLVLPPRDDVIDTWQTSGEVKPLRDIAVYLKAPNLNGDVAANRAFGRGLREAVRTFEHSRYAKLEVWACVATSPAVDPVHLDVTAVERDYGSLKFDGVLRNDSVLVGQLRAGLPMRLSEFQVRRWRLDDGPIVERP